MVRKETKLEKILSTINISELLEIMYSDLLSFYKPYIFTIYLLSESNKHLIVHKSEWPEHLKDMKEVSLNLKIEIEIDNDFTKCFKNNKIIEVKKESSQLDQVTAEMFKRYYIEQGIYMPFSLYDSPIGIICIYSEKDSDNYNLISKIQDHIIQPYYNQCKHALQFSFLKEREEEVLFAKELTTKILHTVSSLSSLTSISLIYDSIIQSFLQLFSFDIGLIFINEQNFLTYRAGNTNLLQREIFNSIEEYFKDIKGYSLSKPDGATSLAYLQKQHFYIPNVQLVKDVPMYEKDKNSVTLLPGIHDLFIAPLVKDNTPIGVIQLIKLTNSLSLKDPDIAMINSLCNLIGVTIVNSQLYSIIEDQNNQITTDLKLASKLQQNLISKSSQVIEGVKITTIFEPMEHIGGDFFNLIRLREPNLLGIIIMDVTGHGVEAALITTMAKALLDTSGISKLHPPKLLSHLNSALCNQTNNNFITAFYCIYNNDTKALTFSNAGHPAPLLIRDGEIIPLKVKGRALAIDLDSKYDKVDFQCRSGDYILLYTDGLTETFNSEREPFEKPLLDYLQTCDTSNSQELTQSIYDKLKKHCGSSELEDDICIVGFSID